MAIRLNDLDPLRKKANQALANMKYKDLQKAVLERGIDFEVLVTSDYPKLSSYFINHFDSRIDKERPNHFDKWMDLKLQERGYKESDPVRQFKRFSAPEPTEEEQKEKEKKPKVEKKAKEKKPPKEKDSKMNIYTGTKKHYSMTLAEKLHEKFGKKYNKKELINKFIGQVVEKINLKFPDSPANEKSVRIWIKRALDAIKE
jgi:hypothetical protein